MNFEKWVVKTSKNDSRVTVVMECYHKRDKIKSTARIGVVKTSMEVSKCHKEYSNNYYYSLQSTFFLADAFSFRTFIPGPVMEKSSVPWLERSVILRRKLINNSDLKLRFAFNEVLSLNSNICWEQLRECGIPCEQRKPPFVIDSRDQRSLS